jgi:hypothetical protein
MRNEHSAGPLHMPFDAIAGVFHPQPTHRQAIGNHNLSFARQSFFLSTAVAFLAKAVASGEPINQFPNSHPFSINLLHNFILIYFIFLRNKVCPIGAIGL